MTHWAAGPRRAGTSPGPGDLHAGNRVGDPPAPRSRTPAPRLEPDVARVAPVIRAPVRRTVGSARPRKRGRVVRSQTDEAVKARSSTRSRPSSPASDWSARPDRASPGARASPRARSTEGTRPRTTSSSTRSTASSPAGSPDDLGPPRRTLVAADPGTVTARILAGYLSPRRDWRRFRIEAHLAARNHPQVAAMLDRVQEEAKRDYLTALGARTPKERRELDILARSAQLTPVGLAFADLLIPEVPRSLDWRLGLPRSCPRRCAPHSRAISLGSMRRASGLARSTSSSARCFARRPASRTDGGCCSRCGGCCPPGSPSRPAH